MLDEFHTANPSAPGAVVRVVCPSRGLEWTAAVGLAERDTHNPLTVEHTFRIASNTKTYVAAAILRLAESGRLSLDDPLGDHLPPDFRKLLEVDDYDLEAMTIRHVLAHTSGMFQHPADSRYEEAVMADPHHRWTRLEQITRCVEWGDAVGSPGEKFSYSDTGYIILGGIIENQTGQNLGAAVRDLLDFQGLGLKATWWEIFEKKPAGAGTTDCRLGIFCVDFGDHLAWGHTGFWNTFAFHVPTLDLTVSGCILDHFATKGQELAKLLVKAVAADSH